VGEKGEAILLPPYGPHLGLGGGEGRGRR
jgi:hypothetical protein